MKRRRLKIIEAITSISHPIFAPSQKKMCFDDSRRVVVRKTSDSSLIHRREPRIVDRLKLASSNTYKGEISRPDKETSTRLVS
jgi:hypothetical protein